MDRMRNFFLGNWVTRAYLAAVLTMSAATLIGSMPACIVLVALTSPIAVIFAPIFLLGTGWMTVPMLWLSVLAGLLLNTLVLNTIVAKLPSSPRGRHGSASIR
jgi:hypothetical protein